jgi:hypothetical protein
VKAVQSKKRVRVVWNSKEIIRIMIKESKKELVTLRLLKETTTIKIKMKAGIQTITSKRLLRRTNTGVP